MRTSRFLGRSFGVAGKRTPKGQGTTYKEDQPNRDTKWVAERWVLLPDGRQKRVRARGVTQQAAIQARDAKARRVVRMNPGADRLTLSQYLDDWLQHKEAHVRASTMRAYRQDVRIHIRPKLGRHKLARVSTQHCQALIDELVNTGRHSMADRVRRTLKQALRHAVKWGLLDTSPMDRVDAVQKPTPKRGTYTRPELRQFLDAARASKFYPFFLLAISTGMRKGELLALQWRDLEAEGVHVRRTVSAKAKGDGTEPPKTVAGHRFVPVEKDAMSVVLATRTPHANDSDWVFTTRNGKRHSVRTISRVMRTFQQRAGLDKLRFHDFRRSYATLLAEAGHHPKVIQTLLGHATPNLAMTIYTEATETARLRAHINMNSGGPNGGHPSAHEQTATGQEGAEKAPRGRALKA